MSEQHKNPEVTERIEAIRRNPKMHKRNSLEALDFCTVNGTVHLDILKAHEEHTDSE